MNKKIKLSCDEIILVNPVSNTVSNNMTNNTITSTNNIVTSTVVTITTNTDQIKVQEKEQKEEYDLTEKQIETILDDISNYSFWSWVMKYRILGINNLYKILGLEMDLKVKDELELLPALKIKFDDYKRRDRLGPGYTTFTDAINLINTSKNIIVLTGAGVSVSCGIPDFRSANGIYSRLSEFQLSDPQEMFDLEYFKFRPETFYSFAKEIYPSNFKPSPSHRFIKMLEDRGKLLRNYTQNIDTLENAAGITRVIQCHGSFATASCISCKYKVDGKVIEQDIFDQRVPTCPKCPESSEFPFLKPDIVFFGENLPNHFHETFKLDSESVDLLIVMGSSLKVAPVANLRDRINKQIPQILINLESLPHMHNFDIHLLGYSDNVTSAIAKELGWTGEVDCEVGFRKGLEPWFWIFEGGVDRVVESEIEIESGSEMTADSNTDEEDLGGFVEGDGLGDDGGLKSSEVNETLEIVDPSSLKKEFVPLARSPKKETPKSLKKDTLLLPSSPKRPKSPNKD